MARDVTFIDYCDVCLYGQSREVEASFDGDVTLGPLRRHLSLCPVHEDELLGPLRDATEQWGRPIDSERTPVRGRRQTGPIACPICLKPVTNRAALASHVRRTHKQSIEDIEAASEATKYYQCAHCEAKFDTTQKLGGHVANRHKGERSPTRSEREGPL